MAFSLAESFLDRILFRIEGKEKGEADLQSSSRTTG